MKPASRRYGLRPGTPPRHGRRGFPEGPGNSSLMRACERYQWRRFIPAHGSFPRPHVKPHGILRQSRPAISTPAKVNSALCHRSFPVQASTAEILRRSRRSGIAQPCRKRTDAVRAEHPIHHPSPNGRRSHSTLPSSARTQKNVASRVDGSRCSRTSRPSGDGNARQMRARAAYFQRTDGLRWMKTIPALPFTGHRRQDTERRREVQPAGGNVRTPARWLSRTALMRRSAFAR